MAQLPQLLPLRPIYGHPKPAIFVGFLSNLPDTGKFDRNPPFFAADLNELEGLWRLGFCYAVDGWG